MEERLLSVSKLINESSNVPEDIKELVLAICKAYVREGIPTSWIQNVIETTFVTRSEEDIEFSKDEKIFGMTTTLYNEQGEVGHKMEYVKSSNYIKLISILTHELGHVITENNTFPTNEKKVFPCIKKTCDFYYPCWYQNEELQAQNLYGYRITDGFLESISTKIFSSIEFRCELKELGYDLEDYVFKDERLFSSRIYDEYKACFLLFDYLMNGKLTFFATHEFNSFDELNKFISSNNLINIFKYLDASNDALWRLKSYEGKKRDEEFNNLLKDYLDKKESALMVASILKDSSEIKDFNTYEELFRNYKDTLCRQRLLPLSIEERKYFEFLMF